MGGGGEKEEVPGSAAEQEGRIVSSMSESKKDRALAADKGGEFDVKA